MGSSSVAVILNLCFSLLHLVERGKSCENILGKISLVKKKSLTPPNVLAPKSVIDLLIDFLLW